MPAATSILAGADVLLLGAGQNFTRKVALNDASWIAYVKGLVAGATNLLLALAVGAALPDLARLSAAMALGIWLHLTEHHAHAYRHEVLEHEDLHTHPSDDGHHQHEHRHRHAHFPDAHHSYGHKH